jgi:methionyl-tRNA formyltransferase
VTFLGNHAWSVPPLEAVAGSSHEVVGVLTRTPRPGRRGAAPRPTPVADAARRLGLPLAEVETVRAGAGFEALAGSEPDVLVVVAYGEILPPAVLEVPAVAPVNVHFSLLPELRGASPVQAALLRGLERTGVTVMVMDAGLDTGPVLRQRGEPIAPEDDAGSLGARLAGIGGELLVAALDELVAETARPTPQDEGRATSAPKLGPEARRIDWAEPAAGTVRRIRAFAPEPGALTAFRGAPLKVLRASATGPGSPPRAAPGVIEEVDASGFVVAAADGGVRLLEVAPAGRRRMRASEFVRGHRPRPGEPMA